MKRFKPGMTFADHLVSESGRGKVRADERPAIGVRLHKWLVTVVAMTMVLLLVRLASLQLLEGGRWRVVAEENRVQRIKLVAPRGKIWDRRGQVLADSRQVLRLDANTGLTIEGWERRYSLGPATAHLLGYLTEVGPDEVGLLGKEDDKYVLGDLIGRDGIEQQYETQLRGQDGGRLVEVDSEGRVVREMGQRPAKPGEDLRLTVDGSLQQLAYDALGSKKGAVVATNPKTGEVLVLVSSPASEYFNRAIGGIYAPGSTFKMVTAIAALAEGTLPPSFTYTDTGVISVGNFAYTNWYFTGYGKTEGETGWVKALTRSVDTFFYKVGEQTGPEKMASWATKLGLGEKSGIDLPGEVAGLIPTPAWKEEAKREKWFLGNTYHMAIGQADLLVTPLQVNVMTGVIAAGGTKCKPHLVSNAPSDLPLNLRGRRQGELCKDLKINQRILDIVRAGMVGACSPGGTAFPLFEFQPQVACKTGTAEYVRPDGRVGTHAWLTAFAPADDPTIAITALVEGGGEGSRVAAPIVRKVLVKYFRVEDTYNYAAISGVGE